MLSDLPHSRSLRRVPDLSSASSERQGAEKEREREIEGVRGRQCGGRETVGKGLKNGKMDEQTCSQS